MLQHLFIDCSKGKQILIQPASLRLCSSLAPAKGHSPFASKECLGGLCTSKGSQEPPSAPFTGQSFS